jgi:hypothetical protein
VVTLNVSVSVIEPSGRQAQAQQAVVNVDHGLLVGRTRRPATIDKTQTE